MLGPFVRKVEKQGRLTDEERDVLTSMSARTKVFRRHEEIVAEGSRPDYSTLIVDGFAIRHNHLRDGRRQITAVHVPGDFADLHSFLLKHLDDGVAALTTCTVAFVGHSDLKQITQRYPYLTRVLWFTTLVDGAVHRAWMTGLGAMEAHERVAHFFCEFRDRLRWVELVNQDHYDLPLTQEELADTLGMSGVHMNRTLQDLRGQGLISVKGKAVTINDWERLKQLAQYDPDYLHLGQQIERD